MTDTEKLQQALANMAAAEGAAATDALIIQAANAGGDLPKLGEPLKALRSESGKKVHIGDELAAEIVMALVKALAK